MRLNRRLVGILAASAVLWAAPSIGRATVLTMEGDVSASANASPPPAGGNSYAPLANNFTMVSEYGDFASGATQLNVPTGDFGSPPYWYNFYYGNNGEGYTPNVAVAKRTDDGFFASHYYSAYGNLSNVVYPNSGKDGGKWYWTFTADPGYLVKLTSTDLVLFNPGPLTATVNVYTGNNPVSLGSLLYTSGPVNTTNVGQTVSLNNSESSSLTLEYAFPAGTAMFNWAADNIVFSQRVVPEPATAATALFGAAALFAKNNRRRRR